MVRAKDRKRRGPKLEGSTTAGVWGGGGGGEREKSGEKRERRGRKRAPLLFSDEGKVAFQGPAEGPPQLTT